MKIDNTPKRVAVRTPDGVMLTISSVTKTASYLKVDSGDIRRACRKGGANIKGHYVHLAG
jgi:hypothetical protein